MGDFLPFRVLELWVIFCHSAFKDYGWFSTVPRFRIWDDFPPFRHFTILRFGVAPIQWISGAAAGTGGPAAGHVMQTCSSETTYVRRLAFFPLVFFRVAAPYLAAFRRLSWTPLKCWNHILT